MIGDEEDVVQEEVLGDLDEIADAGPETAVADSLRTALESMREESGRIASLQTGEEQVQSAEEFAESAGRLDEELGSLARRDDTGR